MMFRAQPFRQFSSAFNQTVSPNQDVSELDETSFQALVQKSYQALMDLPSKKYPDEVFKDVTDEDDQKYAVSTLGLWSLKTAYDSGAFKVRVSDMPKLQAEGELNTPLASHVETTYLFSQDEKFRERYSRSDEAGGAIRYGKIIEELDAIAGDCSYKYLLENLDAT